MRQIIDRQSELFDVSAYESPPENYYYLEDGVNSELGTNGIPVPNSPLPELGTKNISVPNSPSSELGTRKISVPNSPLPELGTKNISVPNSEFHELGTGKTHRTRGEIWKPPVGLLVQTWIKSDWYWYWKYYDNRGKKRSIYLGKKYNKAVVKAQLIGTPADAKPPKTCTAAPLDRTPTPEP